MRRAPPRAGPGPGGTRHPHAVPGLGAAPLPPERSEGDPLGGEGGQAHDRDRACGSPAPGQSREGLGRGAPLGARWPMVLGSRCEARERRDACPGPREGRLGQVCFAPLAGKKLGHHIRGGAPTEGPLQRSSDRPCRCSGTEACFFPASQGEANLSGTGRVPFGPKRGPGRKRHDASVSSSG